MTLDGATRVYRFRDAFHHAANSFSRQDRDEVQLLCDLPARPGSDRAEGLIYVTAYEEPALMVLYDAPHKSRIQGSHAIFADLFRMP